MKTNDKINNNENQNTKNLNNENDNESYTNIGGLLATFLGLLLTFYSTFQYKISGLGIAFIATLASQLILLINLFIYCYQKHAFQTKILYLEKRIEDLGSDNGKLLSRIEEKDKELSDKNIFLLDNMSKIIKQYVNLNRLNSQYCKVVPDLASKTYYVLEQLSKGKNANKSLTQSVIIHSIEDFESGLFDSYKKYTIEFLNYLIETEEIYFSSKGINVQISSTIKLFDNPYFSKDRDRSKIQVYTAFRDRRTYREKKREVGVEPYTIDGNSDYVFCLRNDYFIKNNAINGVDGYENEHEGFESIYNSTVITALKTKLPDGTYKFFGFLCCDYLNHQNNFELFDANSAHVLLSFAQQYVIYLETLNSNWSDRIVGGLNLPTDFLQVIFKNTFRGKN